jgi:hypothetical protein
MIQLILGALALVFFAVACGMNSDNDGSRAGPIVFGLLLLSGAVFL